MITLGCYSVVHGLGRPHMRVETKNKHILPMVRTSISKILPQNEYYSYLRERLIEKQFSSKVIEDPNSRNYITLNRLYFKLSFVPILTVEYRSLFDLHPLSDMMDNEKREFFFIIFCRVLPRHRPQ